MRVDIAKMFAGVDKDWIRVFTSDELGPLLTKVLDSLPEGCNITPSPNDIFNFARLTPYNKVKAVIVGQDPYYTEGCANGLAFSSNAKKIPPSLRNVYKCLYEQKLITTKPSDIKSADLSNWARQGVLLINAALTTVVGTANAHYKIWEPFTNALISYISNDDNCGPCMSLTFMLWGKFAQKKKKFISDDCVVLEWCHPSPLAQNSVTADKKFVSCTNFKDLNDVLVYDNDLTPINWNLTTSHRVYTDGSCEGNGSGAFAVGGYAAYFYSGTFADTVLYGRVPLSVVGKYTFHPTNNRGEGLAIIHGLQKIYDSGETCDIEVVSDSDFWIKMVDTYMPAWERKSISFNTQKNHDLTTTLHELVKKIRTKCKLTFKHVASHGKDPTADPVDVKGNEIADTFADRGRECPTFRIVEERI
jgi:uracil-DNA glycosylase